jgi:hypothetical protein
MRITRKIPASIFSLLLLISVPALCWGETTFTVSGVGILEGSNLAKAEQQALQDAFAKSILQAALKYVPESSIADLMDLLPEYLSSHGTKDVTQYQILSRIQQNGMLQLSVEVKMNDDPLKEWIGSRALATPTELRPKILLMISSREPGKNRTYEWWTGKGKNTYSPFESQFATELKYYGENVLVALQRMAGIHPDPTRTVDIARSSGADLLLTGSIVYAPILDKVYECTLKVSLVDVKAQSTLSSWSVSHRGDMSISAMNTLMIDEIIKPVRSRISARVLSLKPVTMKKTLCIEGINDYAGYQSIINALRAMESVSRISTTGINGRSHSICHMMELKGSLSDVMENLKRRQISEADIIVEDDRASIRILQQ